MQPMGITIACVVVDVDDTVQAGIYYVVYHLMYAVHPSLIHLSVAVHVVEPSHGNPDGTKTGFLHHHHQLGLRLGLSPISLRRQILHATIVGIQGIAQVPAHTHVLDGISSRLKLLCLDTAAEHHYQREKSSKSFLHIRF